MHVLTFYCSILFQNYVIHVYCFNNKTALKSHYTEKPKKEKKVVSASQEAEIGEYCPEWGKVNITNVLRAFITQNNNKLVFE